jgi:D-alanine-D-alanine ligase
MGASDDARLGTRLRSLERELAERGADLALFLVYDRPQRVTERPGLARTFFAQRCVSDKQLDQMIGAFRSIGAYVEVFEGEGPFLAALAEGRLQRIERSLQVAYNGIGWGIAVDGFQPGRKALIPAVADSYGLLCANSDAFSCAFVRHKFHSFIVLRSLGVQTAPVWHYRVKKGWLVGRPPSGKKVIAKSTYEAWSVGVTQDSVFVVDNTTDDRVGEIADAIGQPVTVQEFVPGQEVCVPVLSCPEKIVLPPVEQVLERAPDDETAFVTIHDNLLPGAVTFRRFEGSENVYSRLNESALLVFDIFQLRGFGRVDFRIDRNGCPWVTDVAVSPGLNTGGSAFRSFAELGFDHPSFLRLVVAASLAERGFLEPSIATIRSPAS